MTNIVNTGNASVDALAEMSISGNVTPGKALSHRSTPKR